MVALITPGSRLNQVESCTRCGGSCRPELYRHLNTDYCSEGCLLAGQVTRGHCH